MVAKVDGPNETSIGGTKRSDSSQTSIIMDISCESPYKNIS